MSPLCLWNMIGFAVGIAAVACSASPFPSCSSTFANQGVRAHPIHPADSLTQAAIRMLITLVHVHSTERASAHEANIASFARPGQKGHHSQLSRSGGHPPNTSTGRWAVQGIAFPHAVLRLTADLATSGMPRLWPPGVPVLPCLRIEMRIDVVVQRHRRTAPLHAADRTPQHLHLHHIRALFRQLLISLLDFSFERNAA